MLYLISTYCAIFIYIIFLVTVKETMARYYRQVHIDPDHMEDEDLIFDEEEDEHRPVNLCWGRGCHDFEMALAYSLYLLKDGRIGTHDEREYIISERHSRRYQLMQDSIKTMKYEPAINDDEADLEDCGTPRSVGSFSSSRSTFRFNSCTICLMDF